MQIIPPKTEERQKNNTFHLIKVQLAVTGCNKAMQKHETRKKEEAKEMNID